MAAMRTTPRSEGAARRTDGGATVVSSGPASGGCSLVGSVRVIARSGVLMTRHGPAPGGTEPWCGGAGSGRRAGEMRVAGLDAVRAPGIPGRVDLVRKALDLERDDDPHHADRHRPDTADGDEGGEGDAGAGERKDAERHLGEAEDRQHPPVRQDAAGGEGSGERE